MAAPDITHRAGTHERHAVGRPVVAVPWPLNGPPARSRWRGLAAFGAIGEAVAHIPVIDMHLTEAPYIGIGFILLAITGLGIGGLLLVADTPRVWGATALVGALALAAYAASRTVGLPQIRDDIDNWTEPLGLVAIATEALMLACAIAYAVDRRRGRVPDASR